MLTVYFVRHGQSRDNLERVHQGSKTPLSSLGKDQAEKIAQRLSKHEIDHIFASPQKRAKETAITISKHLKKPIEYWGDIKEMPNPTELVGLHYRHPKAQKIRKVIKKHELQPDWKYSDEESFNETKRRAIQVLKRLEKFRHDQTVVCVSHGSIMKLLMCLIIFGEKLTPLTFVNFQNGVKTNNTGLTKCIFSEKWGWSLITWNDSSHL